MKRRTLLGINISKGGTKKQPPKVDRYSQFDKAVNKIWNNSLYSPNYIIMSPAIYEDLKKAELIERRTFG